MNYYPYTRKFSIGEHVVIKADFDDCYRINVTPDMRKVRGHEAVIIAVCGSSPEIYYLRFLANPQLCKYRFWYGFWFKQDGYDKPEISSLDWEEILKESIVKPALI
ncbi:MAG: hypothetical protein RR365_01155 [Bacteroides sp.]